MLPSCPIMQEIATIPQDAASLHGHVLGNLFYPRLVVSDANDVQRASCHCCGRKSADIAVRSMSYYKRGRVFRSCS